MSGSLNEDTYMINYDNKYINICKSCNNYFVLGRESYLACPYCGGVYSEISGSLSIDNTDATTLSGSYMLDLYFR